MALRVVMLGDIVGRPGRLAVAQQMPAIRQRWRPDLVIVNAENAANGTGLTPELYRKICEAGVDGVTLGDHVYKKRQITSVLEREGNIIRPANLPVGAVGRPWMRLTPPGNPNLSNVYVITVLGRLFMNLPVNDPFAIVEQMLAQLPERDPVVIVEVHAEATSEKQALGWHFNGRVAAVLGTHTHVPTADARILPPTRPGTPQRRGGTAFITDLGMCGPYHSVLGRQIDPVLTHMTTAMPAPFDVAEGDPRVCGVCLEIETETRTATSIERIELSANPNVPPFTA